MPPRGAAPPCVGSHRPGNVNFPPACATAPAHTPSGVGSPACRAALGRPDARHYQVGELPAVQSDCAVLVTLAACEHRPREVRPATESSSEGRFRVGSWKVLGTSTVRPREAQGRLREGPRVHGSRCAWGTDHAMSVTGLDIDGMAACLPRHMEGSWKAHGRFVESLWKVHGRSMEGSWKVRHGGVLA